MRNREEIGFSEGIVQSNLIVNMSTRSIERLRCLVGHDRNALRYF